ncbi:MAG: hypothetical protein IPP15_10150 [Saprospiraceae bacterium]|uniref:non-specific serine/threonine protein kinase n=1 Tax=Candidatus Opimibacter skivensis TaxID=2982028 RepID=A0A9D7XSQ1_9BACT|nr:hypothetical protein [Candidatus Opimibacter skivensis]
MEKYPRRLVSLVIWFTSPWWYNSWKWILTGKIPVELGQLSNLRKLNLSTNQLNGEIPAELGQLDNLTRLALQNNKLSGKIPMELGGLINLEHLNLQFNQLIGEIPKEIGQLSNLKQLILTDNQLGGKIPKELGHLDNLIELLLTYNMLNENIPPELGQLQNLDRLSISNNQLEGNIPCEFDKLTNLVGLFLNENKLSGEIPPTLIELPKLEYLYLINNQFSFEDLINSFDTIQSLGIEFGYTPQDSIGTSYTATLTYGDDYKIFFGIDDTVTTNVYTWYKDGAPLGVINGQNFLKLTSLQSLDEGVYTCEVTNPHVPELTLYSRPVTIRLVSTCRERDSLALVALYQNTEGLNWDSTWNLLEPLDFWFGVELNLNGCVDKLRLSRQNIKGKLPAEIGNLLSLKNINMTDNLLVGIFPYEFCNNY